MNERLEQALSGHPGNHLMPFFWQQGASEETLRDYMEQMDRSGIGAVCVESRPHPDFAGPRWWHDMDIIMEEARQRNMRVWVLDDSHFPTGYANGAVKNAPDRLKRWALKERQIRFHGPATGCKFAVATHLGYDFTDKGGYQFGDYRQEELVAVIAAKVEDEEEGTLSLTDLQDLTSQVNEAGWLYHDFPEGEFRLFLYTKQLGTAAAQNDSISFLEKDSVRLLIDAVYEPHFQHYGADFGKTFAGFFSDEPGFYNTTGSPYEMGRIGTDMPLPWTDDVANQLTDRLESGTCALPGLFHKLGGQERETRYVYMDIITRKYQDNFSDQLGQWCEAHGVEYIGHVLEDGAYNRNLGAGTGHFFRALHGQHMGGIDVVLNGLLPDQDDGGAAFYHYELPMLAASVARQNTKMGGRAMCEVFGAFGWSEGLTLMKWMADYMMVHGINYFVPHAFSCKAFPDMDNPPHFYANGHDPQFDYMGVLFRYMNRVCHLLDGGRALVDVAVLFPAEADWMGISAGMGRVAKLCIQHQIPYDILCVDTLKRAAVKDGAICVGTSAYHLLVVDRVEFLPDEAMELLRLFQLQGANVVFVDRAPEGIHGTKAPEIPLVPNGELLSRLERYRRCITATPEKWLRFYPYVQEGLTIYYFLNSSMTHQVDTNVSLPLETKSLVGYDALNQRLFTPERDESGKVALKLDIGESVLFLAAQLEDLPHGKAPDQNAREELPFQGPFSVSVADHTHMDHFEPLAVMEELEDVALLKPGFGGKIRYEATFQGKCREIALGRCFDGVEVFVNGVSAGTRISYPYRFCVRDLTNDGTNTLRIETGTTLTNVVPDAMSQERPVPPQGIFGPVRLVR